ncbi:hypothetical protein WJX84_001205 [Apatococcus fuscideae]|uniref:Anaphase-promoting complex subunit 13 n=1 Tax=Apatococcus fuscideae TaxID=2026836 RepID=A0AAW1TKW9_9CHLO
MAGTVSYLQTGDPELLDVLDDEWLSDTLPDDDIQLPPGTAPPNDEQEGELVDARSTEPEKWLELGLHTVH